MAPTQKSLSQKGVEKLRSEAGAQGARSSPSAVVTLNAGTTGEGEPLTVASAPEASMMQDIDAILSRLDDGIVKERKAIDELLERIRRPAA